MTKFKFDDDGSRLVEDFNASAGAVKRRARILEALALNTGDCVLDVGSGPGNQAFEMSPVVGTTGRINGVDATDSAIEIAKQRCAGLENVFFQLGDALNLPFNDNCMDTVMSSQVFEYLDDVAGALSEVYRVLKSDGRVLIHDTDWGTTLWHSRDQQRMARIMEIWDDHLVDPHLPQILCRKLFDAGFTNVRTEAFVQIDTDLNPNSTSAILIKAIGGYAVSQGVTQDEIDAWAEDLHSLAASGDYFCSWNEYIFTADRP